MSKRLFIDLTQCDQCVDCTVTCAYFYRSRAAGHGILALREVAQFALVCRRCEEPSCAAACRFEALERQPDGLMKRYNMRCVSCKCCAHACPFGTIYPETVPFYVTRCDFCVSEADREPPCVPNCVKGAVQFREVEARQFEDVHLVGEHLAIRAPRWDKEDV